MFDTRPVGDPPYRVFLSKENAHGIEALGRTHSLYPYGQLCRMPGGSPVRGDKNELRRLSWEESAMQGHSALECLQSVDPTRIPPRQVHSILSSSKIQGY